jgi:hypothetical protein
MAALRTPDCDYAAWPGDVLRTAVVLGRSALPPAVTGPPARPTRDVAARRRCPALVAGTVSRPPSGRGRLASVHRGLSLLEAFCQGRGDFGLDGRFGVDQPLEVLAGQAPRTVIAGSDR